MELPSELRFRYLERRKRDLTNCFQSLELENYSEIEKVGHKLKGNAETFGHEELSSIGLHLEQAALRKDHSSLERVLHEFSDWLNHQVS